MLQIEHNGFKLTYNDNEDQWSCWALRMEHKSLAKLKQKINKWISDKIKTANLIVGVADGSYSSAPPKKKQVVSRDAKTGDYWVIDIDDGSSRSRVEAKKLFPWSPEIDALLEQYRKLDEEQRAIGRKKVELLQSIKAPKGDAIKLMLLDLSKVPEEE